MKAKLLLVMLFAISAFALTGEELAHKLHISPSSKAMIQWQRVFTNKRKMRRLGIDKLTKKEQEILEQYLINHAADSAEPIAAGI